MFNVLGGVCATLREADKTKRKTSGSRILELAFGRAEIISALKHSKSSSVSC